MTCVAHGKGAWGKGVGEGAGKAPNGQAHVDIGS